MRWYYITLDLRMIDQLAYYIRLWITVMSMQMIHNQSMNQNWDEFITSQSWEPDSPGESFHKGLEHAKVVEVYKIVVYHQRACITYDWNVPFTAVMRFPHWPSISHSTLWTQQVADSWVVTGWAQQDSNQSLVRERCLSLRKCQCRGSYILIFKGIVLVFGTW